MTTSNRRSRSHLLLRMVAIVLAGFLLLAAGWVSVRLLQAMQNNQIRCYILSPPLTLFEKDILAGEAFSCQAQNCRVVTRFNTNRGFMCLFPGQGLAEKRPFDTVQAATDSMGTQGIGILVAWSVVRQKAHMARTTPHALRIHFTTPIREV